MENLYFMTLMHDAWHNNIGVGTFASLDSAEEFVEYLDANNLFEGCDVVVQHMITLEKFYWEGEWVKQD